MEGCQRPILVLGRAYGRLCNRLFYFSHFISLALEQGATLWNPSFGRYARLFPATANNFGCVFPPRGWLKTPFITPNDRSVCLFADAATRALSVWNPFDRWVRIIYAPTDHDFDLASLKLTEVEEKVLLFVGWRFRCKVLFRQHADVIRRFFNPLPQYISAMTSMANALRSGRDVLFGIHMRRGDYRRENNGAYFYSLEEYKNWMGMIYDQLAKKKIRFVICSDEAQCEEAFAPFEVSLSKGNPIEDILVLSLCDYLVGPPSTFNAWASFYGKVPHLWLRERGEQIRLDDFQVYTGE